MQTRLNSRRPTTAQTVAILRSVRDILGGEVECLWHDGRFHFPLGDGWTLAVSTDSAERFRLDACRSAVVVDSLWLRPGDSARLERVVKSLGYEIEALETR